MHVSVTVKDVSEKGAKSGILRLEKQRVQSFDNQNIDLFGCACSLIMP